MKFHNGKTVTAEDVVYSINRVAGTKGDSNGLTEQGNIDNATAYTKYARYANLVKATEILMPGCTWIYYGDETNRPLVPGIAVSGDGHAVRSDMNWDSIDTAVLAHWQKVGTFRNNHLSVGAGANVAMTASSGVGFGRTYSKNGTEDKIAAVIGASANTDVSLDVSAIWADGTMLTNYYDDSSATVSGGKITFNSGAHGTILISEPDGKRGRVVVTHINKDTGATIKTETLSGLIGDSYTASPL